MKIFLGTDHGGFKLKEELAVWLAKEGHEVADLGAKKLEPEDDFTDYAFAVSDALQLEPDSRGILLCRNGVGVSIAANRCCGIRCALGFDAGQVEKAREDDDVNCLALPADYIDLDKAISIVSSFIKTKFSGKEKYQHRVEKLDGSSGCCGGGCCGGGCGQC